MNLRRSATLFVLIIAVSSGCSSDSGNVDPLPSRPVSVQTSTIMPGSTDSHSSATSSPQSETSLPTTGAPKSLPPLCSVLTQSVAQSLAAPTILDTPGLADDDRCSWVTVYDGADPDYAYVSFGELEQWDGNKFVSAAQAEGTLRQAADAIPSATYVDDLGSVAFVVADETSVMVSWAQHGSAFQLLAWRTDATPERTLDLARQLASQLS